MYISADTLDDLLVKVFRRLLRKNGAVEINPTKGAATELNGVLLQLRDPRARLSRTEQKGTIFSCLGEFMWYLAGSDKLDFIRYYISGYDAFSNDGETIFGAYGPRLFPSDGVGQVHNVIQMLQKHPDSRRAVIQLFRAEDLAADLVERRKDLPCTCTLQFTVRGRRLNMLVMMRSNDAYKGLPHDVFAFTMLQEIVARSLRVEVGWYKHAVGSLHLYAVNTSDAQTYIEEGFQERIAMPPMPIIDPWPSIAKLLAAEQAVRKGRRPAISMLDPYWADLVRLLQVYRYSNQSGRRYLEDIEAIKRDMSSQVFENYIRKRERKLARATEAAQALLLFEPEALDERQAS
ncbi:thymidylate synthase [Cupriavidus basilensis]